jgi:hypothetical protein
LRNEEPNGDTLAGCRELTWKLADKLRAFDSVEYLEEILTVLFSSSIQSANDRANRLNVHIDKYGALVNPTYASFISRISRENIIQMSSQKKSKNNAPGLWRL